MQYPCLNRAYLTRWTSALRITAATAIFVVSVSAPLQVQANTVAQISQIPVQSMPATQAVGATLQENIALQVAQDFYGNDPLGKDGPLEKLGFTLAQLNAEYQSHRSIAGLAAEFQTTDSLVSITQHGDAEYVVIDAIATAGETANELLTSLEAMGLENGETFGAVVSGEMPISALSAMSTLSTMRFLRPAITETDAGIVTSQADRALGSELARASFGIDGTGIKIGVLSDSYNCLEGAAKDVESGDVPINVEVLADDPRCTTSTDEGRAMVQLINDIAPGAEQAFHTALGGQAAFANAIIRLAETAQADIIVDDLRYIMEPFFQDGIIAQAVDQVVAAGIPYFASAGNNARQSYESPYVADITSIPNLLLPGRSLHDFDPGTGVDTLQQITIPVGETATFNLQWDQPYASATGGNGASSDLDIYLLKESSSMPVAMAVDNNVGRDPIEVLRYTNAGPETTFNLALVHVTGPTPTRMKYIYTSGNITIDEYATNSSTIYGHSNAAGARAVGAAHYLFTPAYLTSPAIVEMFSSAGPTPILFDQNDMPIVDVRVKPEIVAPDGLNTTFFGKDIEDPGDGSDADTFPNFFGTSAAAPNAAAVAALLLATNPELSPSQIYDALQSSALDMGDAGIDSDTGHGLIQALPALERAVSHDLTTTQSTARVTALPGQPVEYVVSVTNQGPHTTFNVMVTNTTSANLLDVTTAVNVDFGAARQLRPTDGFSSTMRVENLEVGSTRLFTVTGTVDPTVNSDVTLVNQADLASLGDNWPDNNQSQASVLVRVPRVQFAAPGDAVGGITVGADTTLYTVVVDQVNPYADVKVHYATSSNRPEYGYIPAFGDVVIRKGEASATLAVPNVESVGVGESITLQLSEPKGAALGTFTSLLIASLPDNDNDGVADVDDPNPQDACNPNKQAGACDQEPDGLTNAEEFIHRTDATKADTDGDGVLDGAEVKNRSNPLDACSPTPKAAACNNGNGGDEDDLPGEDGSEGDLDRDLDGIRNADDLDPNDPCVPNPNSSACQAAEQPNDSPQKLFLPGIRGRG